MKTSLRTVALVTATVAVTAAATTILPTLADRQPAAPAAAVVPTLAQVTAPDGPPLVVGLPDFTALVERVGPAVVNIDASRDTRRRGQVTQEDLDDILGDLPFPIPGMPGGPGQGPGDGMPRGDSSGSGFLVSGDGYVITNHHVVAGSDDVTVRLNDRREFKARVVGSDQQSDIALLKIDAKGLPFLRVGDSRALKPGQWVIAIGSPFGLDHSVTAGVVSGIGRAANPRQRYVPFIQSDVAINPGNSGGPLLNTRGEVVGVNSQIFSNFGGYMGVSFSIPMDVAMNVSDQLKDTGKVTRGQIGVVVAPVSADVARGFKLPDTRGALVNQVMPDGPGDKAGLQPGDVIRSVDGTPINESSDLPPVIGAMAPGRKVTLQLYREGRAIEKQVTLGALDESATAAAGARPAPRDEPAAARPGNALGLVTEPVDEADRRALGLRAGEGVVIARVDGDAAREAGLRRGDVVLRVGTTAVDSPAALDRALGRVGKDEVVMLLVRRGGTTAYVPVVPGEGR